MTDSIHSCGYFCKNPACILAQRDELVEKYIAQPATLKGHEIAQVVNALREVALEYHGSEQLRERIAHIVVPLLQAAQPAAS